MARHGETTWNVAGRYQGRLESPLSPLGERQAAALGAYFGARAAAGDAIPARVVSSPLRRCTETAQAVARELGEAVEVDERLIEIGHGTWEGRYRDELARADPERYRLWRKDPASVSFPGGESLADVLGRWQSFARELVLAPRDTLVVTHDAVVRCALIAAEGRPLEDFWKVQVENAGLASFKVREGRLRLVEECFAGHLGALRAATDSQAL